MELGQSDPNINKQHFDLDASFLIDPCLYSCKQFDTSYSQNTNKQLSLYRKCMEKTLPQ